MFAKPDNHKEFIINALERVREGAAEGAHALNACRSEPCAHATCHLAMQVKMSGTQSLLNADDLITMFGMFDVTNRGTITDEQVRRACSAWERRTRG